MNKLIGTHLSIVTPKAQTTRQRIMGIVNGDTFQIVYSDTPGILEPKYALHRTMMEYVHTALEDADVVLLTVDATTHTLADLASLQWLHPIDTPLIVLLNKVDICDQAKLASIAHEYRVLLPNVHAILGISALHDFNLQALKDEILNLLPEHPPYFDKEDITDRTERFIAAELIREQLFLQYEQEIPYACQIVVHGFKDSETILRIHAYIFVERDSQKAIVIGKKGQALKTLGIASRMSLEAFFGKQVHLETTVKVEENWRSEQGKLARLGLLN